MNNNKYILRRDDKNAFDLGLDICNLCPYKVFIFGTKGNQDKYKCIIFNKLLEEVTPFPELEYKEYLRLKECIDSEVKEENS